MEVGSNLTVASELRYRTGRYVVDLAARHLFLDDKRIILPWRCFEAFVILVEANGAIVDRETLFRRLWPGIEVEETSLTKVLSQLRRVLSSGDPAAEYVETIPRLGYRLAVTVRSVTTPNGAAAWPPVGRHTGRGVFMRVVGGLLIVVIAGILGTWGWRRYRTIEAAEDHYQEGRRLNRQSEPSSTRGAIEEFRRATELNPSRALYFTALAQALNRVTSSEPTDFQSSRQAAERSVELDPACGGCQATLGFVLFTRFWEWEKAGVHLRQGARLDPENPGLRGYVAMYLCSQGKPAEALGHMEEAIGMAPYFARSHQLRTAALVLLGRYPEAIAASDRALSLNALDKATWDWRAHALLLAGREREALAAWLEFGWKEHAAEIDELYRANGIAGALRRLLELTGDWKSRGGSSYRRAQWRMHLGEHEKAIEELELAVQFRHFNLIYVSSDPVFAAIRSRPEFQAVLTKLGLRSGSV